MLAEKAAEEKRSPPRPRRSARAVEAEAQKLLYEAENVLTDEARYGLFRRRLLDRIEGIVRESVKPMEKIEGIRILQVDGLGGTAMAAQRRSPTDEVIELGAALPCAGTDDRQVLKEIGIEGGSLSRLGGLMREASDMQRDAKEAGPGKARRQPPPARAGEPSRPPRDEARPGSRDGRESTYRVSSPRPRPRSGRGCATSMLCRAGIRRIAESRIENGEPSDKVGCVRDFRLRNGDRIREQLLGLSDYDMFCTYSILESPMGVDNYVATLRLTPVTDGERTFIEWTASSTARRSASRARRQHRQQRVPGRLRRPETAVRRLTRHAESRQEHDHGRAGRPGVGGAARLQRPSTNGIPAIAAARSSAGSVRQGRLRTPLPPQDGAELREQLLDPVRPRA